LRLLRRLSTTKPLAPFFRALEERETIADSGLIVRGYSSICGFGHEGDSIAHALLSRVNYYGNSACP
jgi:hypothetical protein